MTSKQFVALGVRLFSIWLFIYILRAAPAWWMISTREIANVSPQAAVAMVIGTGVLALIALLLWLFPLAVARKLLPRSAQDQTFNLPPAEQIERAGFCLLGLWLLTQALPGLVFESFTFYQYTRPGSTLELAPQDYARLAEVLAEFCISVWMLFGAKGLLGIIHWTRNAGTRIASDDLPPTP